MSISICACICSMYVHCMYIVCTMCIWAIPREITYILHKKSQLVGQLIKEGEYSLIMKISIKQVQTFLQVL